MGAKQILLRNVLSNWAGLLLSVLVGFFMSPFLVHSLGDSMYGIWVLVLSVTGYMGLLDTGLKTSIVRYVSRFNAVSDRENLDRVVSTSFVLYSALSVVAIALTVAVATHFERLFTVDPEALDTIRTVVYLGGIGVAITLPISVFGGLLVGFQRYDQLNKANILLLGLRTAAIVAALSLGYGIVALSGIQLAAQVLLGGILVWYARRQYSRLKITLAAFRKDTAKMLFSYSGFMLMNNLAMYSLFYSGEVLIGIFLGSAAITYYAIATGLVHYLSKFIGAMTQVLHPYASDQEARGNAEKLKEIIVQGTKWCLLLVLPVALTYIVLGRMFISLWMGPAYAELSGTVLVIAAMGRILWLSQSGTGNILVGAGKHKVIASSNIATGAASILLSALLIQRYGIVGVAIGTSLALSVSQLVILVYACRTFHIRIVQYVRDAWVGPLLASVPFVAGLLVIREVVIPPHLFAFFAEVALALLLFVVPAYFVCFTASERQAYFHRYLRWTTVTVRGV